MFNTSPATAAALNFVSVQRRMAMLELRSVDRQYWLGKARRRIESLRRERGADNSQGALPWE